jgi:hypothetical protein
MYIRCTYGLYNAEKFIGFRLVSVGNSDELCREIYNDAGGYAIVGVLPLYSESTFSCETESYIALEYFDNLSVAFKAFKGFSKAIEQGVEPVYRLSQD